MKNTFLFLAAFLVASAWPWVTAIPALAAPMVDPAQEFSAMTDRMQAQAARDAALTAETKVQVPSGKYLGQPVTDPFHLPFYTSLSHIQFSDGLIAHTIHDATDTAGRRHIVVLAHGVARGDTSGWHVATDQLVDVPSGTKFTGSDNGKTTCRVNGNVALVFGFLVPNLEADGQKHVVYELDPHSNLIPMTGFKASCGPEI